MSGEKFIKELDSRLYKEYLIEKLSGNKLIIDDTKWNAPIPFVDQSTELYQLKTISQLKDHPAKNYVESRYIPKDYHSLLRWCPDFMEWTNNLIPGKFSKEALRYDEGRILIPYLDERLNFCAFQGRAISHTSKRYILIVLDHSSPIVFGLNTVDLNKDVYVFEGPIDSMFIQNSVAGPIFSLTKLADVDKFIVCFDNEPHSIQTRKKISKAITQGFRVCIWPDSVIEKDVNEMICNGYTVERIETIIKENTFSNMMARARLEMWSKT
jgi:hypothetical protein